MGIQAYALIAEQVTHEDSSDMDSRPGNRRSRVMVDGACEYLCNPAVRSAEITYFEAIALNVASFFVLPMLEPK